jgi:hypothetical protein
LYQPKVHGGTSGEMSVHKISLAVKKVPWQTVGIWVIPLAQEFKESKADEKPVM